MTNGTLDFYSTTATVIPVLILAYIFSFRIFGSLKKLYEAMQSGAKRGILLRHSGITTLAIFVTPIAGVTMSISGEIASLNALYTGHPTNTDARWTIISLYAIGAAFGAQILAACLAQAYAYFIKTFSSDEEPLETNSLSSDTSEVHKGPSGAASDEGQALREA
jgi:hypothetical protein